MSIVTSNPPGSAASAAGLNPLTTSILPDTDGVYDIGQAGAEIDDIVCDTVDATTSVTSNVVSATTSMSTTSLTATDITLQTAAGAAIKDSSGGDNLISADETNADTFYLGGTGRKNVLPGDSLNCSLGAETAQWNVRSRFTIANRFIMRTSANPATIEDGSGNYILSATNTDGNTVSVGSATRRFFVPGDASCVLGTTTALWSSVAADTAFVDTVKSADGTQTALELGTAGDILLGSSAAPEILPGHSTCVLGTTTDPWELATDKITLASTAEISDSAGVKLIAVDAGGSANEVLIAHGTRYKVVPQNLAAQLGTTTNPWAEVTAAYYRMHSSGGAAISDQSGDAVVSVDEVSPGVVTLGSSVRKTFIPGSTSCDLGTFASPWNDMHLSRLNGWYTATLSGGHTGTEGPGVYNIRSECLANVNDNLNGYLTADTSTLTQNSYTRLYFDVDKSDVVIAVTFTARIGGLTGTATYLKLAVGVHTASSAGFLLNANSCMASGTPAGDPKDLSVSGILRASEAYVVPQVQYSGTMAGAISAGTISIQVLAW